MSKDVRCGFVVLHYQSLVTTQLCVSRLFESLGNQDIQVVIVDNASPNGSGRQLQEYYMNHEKVQVLLANENLGFARGNNLGYAWFLDNYDLDFIVIMNNDVLIEQDTFIHVLYQEYQRSHFAVLGPDIFEPSTRRHRNPYRDHGYTFDEAQDLLKAMRRWDSFFAPRYASLHMHRLIEALKTSLEFKQSDRHPARSEGCMLQGSCFVFSRIYTGVRSVAFCPDTFLYFEEAILCRDCEKLNLPMVYCPDVQVIHLGSVSTKTLKQTAFMREKRKNKEHLASVQVFLNRYFDNEIADR